MDHRRDLQSPSGDKDIVVDERAEPSSSAAADSTAVAAAADNTAAVVDSNIAVAAAPSKPSGHWVEVRCCWTWKTGPWNRMDWQMHQFAVSWMHLHTGYQARACQTHQPVHAKQI